MVVVVQHCIDRQQNNHNEESHIGSEATHDAVDCHQLVQLVPSTMSVTDDESHILPIDDQIDQHGDQLNASIPYDETSPPPVGVVIHTHQDYTYQHYCNCDIS